MTTIEAQQNLAPEILPGFNLALAGDNLHAVFVTGEVPMEDCHSFVEVFAQALDEYHFSESSLIPVDSLQSAAEKLNIHVRSVTGQETAGIEDIALHMKHYMNGETDVSLREAFQYALFDMLQFHWHRTPSQNGTSRGLPS